MGWDCSRRFGDCNGVYRLVGCVEWGSEVVVVLVADHPVMIIASCE